nr:GtrA family protein [Micromonospora sp. DSM 115978]
YQFAERHAGQSNASMGEGLRFVRRLFSLRVPRPARFAIVGATGAVPNVALTWALHAAGLHYLVAAVIATQVAVLWNFVGCELLVWEREKTSRLRRYFPFAAVNNVDLVLRVPLLALLVDRLALGVGTATLLTLATAVVVRYLVVDRVIYREPSVSAPVEVAAPVVEVAAPVVALPAVAGPALDGPAVAGAALDGTASNGLGDQHLDALAGLGGTPPQVPRPRGEAVPRLSGHSRSEHEQ